MEKRKAALNLIKACRFCLTQDAEKLTSLYDRSMTPKSNVALPLQIMSCISVEVFPSDGMVTYICEKCRFFMDVFYRFKSLCRQADEAILQFVQNDEPIESITWPVKLTRLYRSPKDSSKQKDNLQQTSDDLSEDENVFNIQLGDNTSDNIKVVRSKEKFPKEMGRRKKDASPGSRSQRSVNMDSDKHIQCNHCEKTFTKQCHYTRHLRLKHQLTSLRGPFGGLRPYPCEQCSDSFKTQDELIYHSARHATENLTCPLCHEKFEQVEDVSNHIKTHVEGDEYMCDMCELVFTSKEKLDKHLQDKHSEELLQEQDFDMNDDSMETFEDEDNINLKDEGDHMVVEIKKPSEFIITTIKTPQPQLNKDIEEDKDEEEKKIISTPVKINKVKETAAAKKKESVIVAKPTEDTTPKPEKRIPIFEKAEEVKLKAMQKQETEKKTTTVKEKNSKPENATSGASDKSLRLLEKELQELKRTTTSTSNNDTPKSQPKSSEVLRNRRPQLHTSTPKIKPIADTKVSANKVVQAEKKVPERRVLTKENKEPKEKEAKEKEVKDKEAKEKEPKDKEAKLNNNSAVKEDAPKEKEVVAKSIVKNGSSERSSLDDSLVRRSNRSSKVKDYAKMVRDRVPSDDDSTDDDEEYKESPTVERTRSKKVSKPAPAGTKSQDGTPTPARKRGRPKKVQDDSGVAAKLSKPSVADTSDAKTDLDNSTVTENNTSQNESKDEDKVEPKSNVIVSPSGQALKKIPIKSLPPGVKPLPLPAKSMAQGEVCEMQIGKKVVKVQKIVMTKADVEAMAKKGLLEMKDGTMVLKQGIKLPQSDAVIKSTLVGQDGTKESPTKTTSAPTRSDLEENVEA